MELRLLGAVLIFTICCLLNILLKIGTFLFLNVRVDLSMNCHDMLLAEFIMGIKK